MYKPDSAEENKIPKILCDCEIQTDYLISPRRSDQVIINNKNNNNKKVKKRTCHQVDFAVPADHNMKIKERKKRDKCLDLARELRRLGEHEG